MDAIERLLEHDQWAMRDLLARSGQLTDAQLDQEFDIGHRTLRETLDHTIFVIGFWTGLMLGEPIDPYRRNHQYDRSVPGLTELFERNYASFAALARRVRDEQQMDDTFVDHFGERPTLGGGVLHVILHNAEHRTEMLHILHRLGVSDLEEVDHLLWEHTTKASW